MNASMQASFFTFVPRHTIVNVSMPWRQEFGGDPRSIAYP
jgi:hypothetical protein